jgi:hypothetical protein
MNSKQRAAARRTAQRSAVTRMARRFVGLLRGEEGMYYYEVVTKTATVRIAFTHYFHVETITGVFALSNQSNLRAALESAVTSLGAEALLDDSLVPSSDPDKYEISATYDRTYGDGQTVPNGMQLSELVLRIRALVDAKSIVRQGFVFMPDSTTDMPVSDRFRPIADGFWALAA